MLVPILNGNNGDGSGTYTDKSKNLVIENDGKGKAKITFNGQTTEVDAKPLENLVNYLN